MNKELEKIKKEIIQTLKARIIPSLPITGWEYLRPEIRRVIDNFEFDYSLNEAFKAGKNEQFKHDQHTILLLKNDKEKAKQEEREEFDNVLIEMAKNIRKERRNIWKTKESALKSEDFVRWEVGKKEWHKLGIRIDILAEIAKRLREQLKKKGDSNV